MAVEAALPANRRSAAEIDHFRRDAFVWLAICAGTVAWIWIGVLLQARQVGPSAGLLLAGLTLGTGLFIVQFYESRYRWAVGVFLLALIFFISYAYWITGAEATAYTFLLVIVMAGALLAPGAAFGTAAAILLLQFVWFRVIAPMPGGGEWLAALTLHEILAALVAWRAARGLHDALQSAELSAEGARRHAEEARQHRAELQRTLKSLDLANYQLQRANTELFHAREIADEALRFKAEFAAHISHELRTSLNLILGFSETMSFAQHSYGVKLPGPYLRDVTEIYRNSRHLLSLIDDILDLSKLDAGRMGLHREETDLAELIGETVEIIRPLVETKGLQMIVDVAPALPALTVDRSRIRQVLLNLLSNATRVTSKGYIAVRALLRQEWLVIEVSDTGPGIAENDRARVFDEFHQLVGASGSAGLGLAISRRIISLHGGRTGVDSQVGQGSTFYFQLPLDDSNIPRSAAGRRIPPSQSPLPALVLVGDAESDEVKLLQRHLGAYQVTVAAAWDEARRLIRQVSARAVITANRDVAPPADLPVPVIVCPLPSAQETARSLGVNAFLQKPVTVRTVQETLQRVAPQAGAVLVVDDQPAATRMLERMVLTHNPDCAVFRAYSGKEALARLQAQPADVVLLDMAMLDGDGLWLLAQMRQAATLAAIPVVAVSGRAVEESWQSRQVTITSAEGFTTTESLGYLQGLLSAVPPAPVELYTSAPPSPAEQPL